jgi:hypothetical protein
MGLEDWSRQTFWVVLLNGFFVNLQNFGIDQNYVQRYIASSSEKEARKSVWLGGLLYVPVSAVFFLIGTALFAFYLSHPDDIAEVRDLVATQRLIREGLAPSAPDFIASVATKAATLSDADIGDGVFPHFIGKYLPSDTPSTPPRPMSRVGGTSLVRQCRPHQARPRLLPVSPRATPIASPQLLRRYRRVLNASAIFAFTQNIPEGRALPRSLVGMAVANHRHGLISRISGLDSGGCPR